MVFNPLVCNAVLPRQTHGVLARVDREDAAREREVVRSIMWVRMMWVDAVADDDVI